ncbi:hypothetical protein EGR_07527 [Echinococcus granulosus]|uniref:Uncharacterized protein n=1 Tax=Echinococcus granulosus TaxID=6210 RepID=W6U995_ECHGR|nr:hypothetical protein EGR_07527 [Echinococcus granulosus]EUB57585.1 hypothetical protein EGR_07527 [Echinococcus granulosus]
MVIHGSRKCFGGNRSHELQPYVSEILTWNYDALVMPMTVKSNISTNLFSIKWDMYKRQPRLLVERMQTCISKRRSASQSVGALLEQGRISNKTRNELSGIECTNEK